MKIKQPKIVKTTLKNSKMKNECHLTSSHQDNAILANQYTEQNTEPRYKPTKIN
jgi:hypothetical protein